MFLARRYEVKWNAWARYFFFNGADQLALYSARYYLLYALFAALFLAALAMDCERPVARGRLLECLRDSFAALSGGGNGFGSFAYAIVALPAVPSAFVVILRRGSLRCRAFWRVGCSAQ